jgi:single-strand DNA-binding protein
MQRNRIILNGYVGNHLDASVCSNGNKRVSIRVATHHRSKNRNGTYIYHTTWHDVVAWDKKAEYAERTFVKGSRIWVEGAMEYRRYPDKTGHVRYTARIRAFSLDNLDR